MTSRADRTVPTVPTVPTWIVVLLALGAVSTTVTVLGLAWLSVWFQLFGETADRGDYAVAAGVSAGGAVFSALASLAARLCRAPRWLTVWCWVSTGLLVVVAIACRSNAGDTDLDPASSYDTVGSGFTTTLQMPWCWLVVAALVAAVAVRVSGGSAGGARPGS